MRIYFVAILFGLLSLATGCTSLVGATQPEIPDLTPALNDLQVEKNRLELSLGYSKPVIYEIPGDIEIVLDKPTSISVKGIDKQRVGQEAHKIRSFRKPDPYKLKGVRYIGERLIKKERKAGVAGV